MEKDLVIKLRDTLKAGKNHALRILINNSFTVIDESFVSHFTKWDDTNGVLYSFRLPASPSDPMPDNRGNAVSVFAVSYDTIEAIELAILPYEELEGVIDSMNAAGANIGSDYKELILHTYKMLLHPGRFKLDHSDINNLLGSKLDTKDEYYNGRFVDSFKETAPIREHNEYVESLKNKTDSTNSNDMP